MVGWLRRVSGDEWEMVGARIFSRFGESQALASLAAKGPYKESGKQPTKLLEASVQPEQIHRLAIGRCIPCDVKAWAEACPKPKGWVEE
jgi:hypothetical protein